jgi:hypothetical protein
MNPWFLAAAFCMILTAIAHSYFGEKRLIAPLLALKLDLLDGYRPSLVRFSWHITSLLMVLTAMLVAWPGTPLTLIQLTGTVWLAAGLADALYTRFKHVGWPLLSLSGLLIVTGAAV